MDKSGIKKPLLSKDQKIKLDLSKLKTDDKDKLNMSQSRIGKGSRNASSGAESKKGE